MLKMNEILIFRIEFYMEGENNEIKVDLDILF